MDSYYKLRQLFLYKVRHGLLQIAMIITNCDSTNTTLGCQFTEQILTASKPVCFNIDVTFHVLEISVAWIKTLRSAYHSLPLHACNRISNQTKV